MQTAAQRWQRQRGTRARRRRGVAGGEATGRRGCWGSDELRPNGGNERRGAPAGHRGRRSQAQVLEELLSSSARATGTDGAGGDAGRQAAQLHRAPATRRLGTGLGEGLAEEVEAGTEARQGRTLARHSQIRRRRLRWLAGGAEATRRRPQVREEAALVGGSRDLAGGAARSRSGAGMELQWRWLCARVCVWRKTIGRGRRQRRRGTTPLAGATWRGAGMSGGVGISSGGARRTKLGFRLREKFGGEHIFIGRGS